MQDLTFDSEKHEYRLAGRVVPSVTQVIGAVLPGWQAARWYLDRGLAIHHGCRLEDEGRLDWSTVSDEIAPRIQAWRKFLADSGASVLGIEKQMVHRLHQFAGTMDREIAHNGDSVVLDLKSTIEPQVRLQLGAYSLLMTGDPEQRNPVRAVAVELHDDGSYACLWLDRHELRRAEQQFLACLTVYSFMKAHNLKGKP